MTLPPTGAPGVVPQQEGAASQQPPWLWRMPSRWPRSRSKKLGLSQVLQQSLTAPQHPPQDAEEEIGPGATAPGGGAAGGGGAAPAGAQAVVISKKARFTE